MTSDPRENPSAAGEIVVGVDGSGSSKAALRWALGQARSSGGRLRAVTAWEMPVRYGWPPILPYPYPEPAVTASKMLTECVHAALGLDVPDVEVGESVVCGHPAQVLVDASAHAALLVVGSRGLGTFSSALLGSVSNHCVQHAHCPVVIVRDSE